MFTYERIPPEFEEDFPLLPANERLTHSERKILHCLNTQRGKLVSKVSLMDALERPEPRQWSNSLEVLISYLRDKIEPLGWRIVGIRHQGYILVTK